MPGRGIAPPKFEEITGAAVVTFKVNVPGAQREAIEATPQGTMQVSMQVEAVLQAAVKEPKSREQLQIVAGIKNRDYFWKAYIQPLLASGRLERTIPDKPKSRLQRYRATPSGLSELKKG